MQLCLTARPPRLQRRLLWLAACASALVSSAGAYARPTAPALLCQQYSDIPECSGKVVGCDTCHETVDPPTWNPFGTDLRSALDRSETFEEALAGALRAIEEDDSDGDGVTNVGELTAGTAPGDAMSTAGETNDTPEADEQPAYDLAFAYKRAVTLYCGQSPSYDQLKKFRETAKDEATGRKRLHEALAECLRSDYWQKDAVLRLADKRIKPQASLGPDTDLRLGQLRPVLGDYWFDYRLWRFIMSDDRDMRELLTADYHVLEAEDGTLTQTWELLEKPSPMDLGGGQPLDPQYRAGMITTQWFLHSNTMVSALPRTTAAQAYRAYLGADISAMQGLMPVPGEPADVDNKGVKQARCAGCHSTLDPLSYAFAKYEGSPSRSSSMRMMTPANGEVAADGEMTADDEMTTDGGIADGGVMGMPMGQYDVLANIGGYNAQRPFDRIPGWDDEKQQPYVLGQPVDDLIGLVKVAVASDQFKRNLAEMFFRHALGAEPTLAQQAEFKSLWQSMPDDDYSANRLIHRLVDTHSFGAP